VKRNVLTILYLMNGCISIVLGGIIYLFTAKEIIFLSYLEKICGIDLRRFSIKNISPFLLAVRYYMPDFLWAYSFVFFLFLINKCIVGKLKKIMLTVVTLGAVFEVLQKMNVINGYFDLADILVEATGVIFACYVIKKLSKGV